MISLAFTPDRRQVRIAFHYDPKLVELMRGLRVRRYDRATNQWLVPFCVPSMHELLEVLARQPTSIEPELRTAIMASFVAANQAGEAHRRGDASLDGFAWHSEPWPHQRAAVVAAASLPGYAILWDRGTGKTKAAIDAVRHERHVSGRPQRALVIAPNEVVRNWAREVRAHAGEEAWVLDSAYSLKERIRMLESGRLPTFTVLNCEVVAPLRAPLGDLLWDFIIVDEATRFKNPSAQRTKALRELWAERRLILTGTPVANNLLDVYAPYSFLVPGLFGSYSNFKWRYFEMGWDGFRPKLVPRMDRMPELLAIIDGMSYRVTKAEVLPWLPAKLPPETLEVTLAGEQAKAYQQMRRDLRVWMETQEEGWIQAHASVVLTQLLRLCEITSGFVRDPKGAVHWLGEAKAKVVDELLEDILPRKAVLFCNWRPECEFYEQRYRKHGSALIYGGIEPRDRDAIVEEFQTRDSIKVLVCQEQSGGIGINLTAAAHAIYTSRSWSLEAWEQSQDRLHRAGQRSEVSIVVVQARDTIDERIAEVLQEKAKIADIVSRDSLRKELLV